MAPLYQHIHLANGLNLCIYDRSRLYYGEYHHVKLVVSCTIELAHCTGIDLLDLEEGRRLLGEAVVYRRNLEKMGVPASEIERVKRCLLEDFASHSLPYFSDPAFPVKLVLAEFNRVRKNAGRAAPRP